MTRRNEIFELIKKDCFKMVCFLLLAGIVLLGLCFTYVSKVKPTALKEKEQISVSYNVIEEEIENGDVASQTFQCSDDLEYIDINFAVNEKNTDDPFWSYCGRPRSRVSVCGNSGLPFSARTGD